MTEVFFCLLIKHALSGFVISCAVDNERSATYMALGSFLPLIMLCGIIWPIEGMHPILKAPALFLPLTKSTESLRSILQRGWPIEDPQVYVGFVSTGIWILIFLTFSILLLKFKKGWARHFKGIHRTSSAVRETSGGGENKKKAKAEWEFTVTYFSNSRKPLPIHSIVYLWSPFDS